MAAQAELEQATAAAIRAEQERAEVEFQSQDLQSRVGNMAREVYQNGAFADFDLLITADSALQLADRAAAIDAVSRVNNLTLSRMAEVRAELALKEARLELLRQEVDEKRQLAAWVDSGALASQITAVCINTTVIWARGMLPDEAVEAGMTYPGCMLALAAARGAARKALEDRAQAAQQVLTSVGVVQEPAEPLQTSAAERRKR